MKVEIRTMASGGLAIDLGDEIDGGIFPRFAEILVERQGWRVVSRQSDPGGHIYEVEIGGHRYHLSWDEWTGATLASCDPLSSAGIPFIAEALAG